MKQTISRRTLLQNALAGAVAAPAVLRGARKGGDKPNLLFLWTDQQRANTLAVNGNYRFRVPVMNDLASKSIVFRRCHDTQPVCTPARSSIMTGLWPHQNGCLNNNLPLNHSIKVFPETLPPGDYYTGYMGKWHLGDEVFKQHGFDEWESIEDLYIQYYSPGRDRTARSSYHHFLISQGYKPDQANGTFSRDFAVQRTIEHCKPSFLAAKASDFILRKRNQPWILYVNFLEPHPPYYGPLNDLLSEKEAPLPRNYPGIPVEKEPEAYAKRRKELKKLEKQTIWKAPQALEGDARTKAELQRMNRNYAGNCSLVDRSLGRILWSLEASGQAENTIVVFTSDHGEMGGSHSLIQKSVMYEEALHVPLCIRVPFRHSRQICVDRPVSQVDLVPTLAELMTGKPAEALPGESWIGMLEGGNRRDDHIYLQWNDLEDGPNCRTVISPDGWKLAIHDKDHGLLFNRNFDPLEMSNLYYRPESSAVISRLRKKIEAWQQRVGDKLTLPDRLI